MFSFTRNIYTCTCSINFSFDFFFFVEVKKLQIDLRERQNPKRGCPSKSRWYEAVNNLRRIKKAEFVFVTVEVF